MFNGCVSVLVCWKNLKINENDKMVKNGPLNSNRGVDKHSQFAFTVHVLVSCNCVHRSRCTTNVSKLCIRSKCIPQLEIYDSNNPRELLNETHLQFTSIFTRGGEGVTQICGLYSIWSPKGYGV